MKNIKLVTLDVSRFHHAEFGQFITRLGDDVSQSQLNTEADTHFKMMLDSLKVKNSTYGKALEQIRENENTQKIAELDKVRDSDFQALKDSIKPYRNTRKPQHKAAYNALKIVLDEYKNIVSISYEEETHKIKSLLSVLRNETNMPYLTLLNIVEFVQELEKSNTAFDTLFAERSVQNIGKETYDTKALRREMTDIYKKLAKYTLTMAEVKSDEFYIKALEVINNSRKYYADTLAKRNGQTKEKKEGEKP